MDETAEAAYLDPTPSRPPGPAAAHARRWTVAVGAAIAGIVTVAVATGTSSSRSPPPSPPPPAVSDTLPGLTGHGAWSRHVSNRSPVAAQEDRWQTPTGRARQYGIY